VNIPKNVEEFKALPPEERQQVLAEMKRINLERIHEMVNATFDRHELEQSLVPKVPFRRVNLDPPPMSDSVVREKFRSDPNLRELTVGGIKFERI
jgi:hypothetical protein